MKEQMDYAPQIVRDGPRRLKFVGKAIAHVSSARERSPRWSEITIYTLPSGSYVCSKIGASTVAHRPTCAKVSREMIPWIELADSEESKVARTPCGACQPVVAPLDPHTLVEVTRYFGRAAASPGELLQLLVRYVSPDQPIPRLVQRVIEEAAAVDQSFASAVAGGALLLR